MKELSNRSFGLEFEVRNRHSWELYSRGVERALAKFPEAARFRPTGQYGHSDGRFWEFKSDSSCGWELVTPALSWKDWPQVEAVLAELRECGATTDNACGFHVHHELRDGFDYRHLRRLVMLWVLFEDLMFASVTPTRRDNEFCRDVATRLNIGSFLWQSRNRQDFRNLSADYGHYSALNINRWWELGLVEFRLHHGTLDVAEAKRWVLLTQAFVELARTRAWSNTTNKFLPSPIPTKLKLFHTAVRKFYDHPEILKAAEELQEVVRRHHPQLLER